MGSWSIVRCSSGDPWPMPLDFRLAWMHIKHTPGDRSSRRKRMEDEQAWWPIVTSRQGSPNVNVNVNVNVTPSFSLFLVNSFSLSFRRRDQPERTILDPTG
jgi:hypothetical protein